MKYLRSTFKWNDISKKRPKKNTVVLVGDDSTGDVGIMIICEGNDCCDNFYEYEQVYVAILGEIDSDERDRVTHWAYIKKPGAINYRDRAEEVIVKSTVRDVKKAIDELAIMFGVSE